MGAADQEHYADSKLFDDLGRYFVIFQSLESYLDRMILLAIGLGRYHIGRAVIAKLSNRAKIDVLNAAVLGSRVKTTAESLHPEWLGNFRSFIKACEEEAEIRNSFAHANLIFDFVKIGGPVLKNQASLGKRGIRISNKEVNEKTMHESLQQISKLCMDANFIHVQLVHWSDHFDQETRNKNFKGEDAAFD